MMDQLDRLSTALAQRYEIDRELGAGGMATVYLARDVKHRRKVALKVLRPELAAILGTERFLKEIEVTANLRHPHILPLFDSGDADGFPYYVMPYIEGESLRDKLDRETQLPIEESITIAEAVASALDYAHRNDVIHRDIKPANILLQEGQPVVADFGIALAVTAAGGRRLTETGLSIGTPEYMSPEQGTGTGTVDSRTDQYSLGCVVYEMLLGEPPHTGPTAQAVIAKALTDEPRRITAARETVPAHVEFAIHRALAKLPADRFATVAEFAEALTNPDIRGSWIGSIPALVRGSVGRRWATRISMVALAGAALWGWLRPASNPPSPPTRFEMPFPVGEEVGRGKAALAISPDGSFLAYAGPGVGVGSQQLYLRRMDQLEARVMPGTDGALDPFFSPDGQWVGYSTVVGLMKVPVTGGPPAEIVEFSQPRGASWGEDDTILFGSTSGLWRVSADGGVAQQVTALDTERGDLLHSRPQRLPGGRGVIFTVGRGGVDETHVAILSEATGEISTLFPGISPRFSPSGHLLYGRADGVLMGVAFDPARLETTGPAAPLLNDITVKPAGTMDFAVSRNGSLTYLTGVSGHGTVVMVDRNGNDVTLIGTENVYVSPTFSPDGERLAIGIGVPPTRQIWTYEIADSVLTPLTFEGHNYYPVWSPGGETVAFTIETDSNSAHLGSIPSNGSGATEILLATGTHKYPESWVGQHLVYREQDARTQRDIWVLPLEGDRTPRRLFALPTSQEEAPRISPDGRWLAFSSDLSGRYEIYVTSFPEPGARRPVSLDGGTEPVWSRDGRELFYRRGREMIVASVETRLEFRVRERSVLFEGPYVQWRYHSNYDVHPDGQHFVMVKPGAEEQSARLVVVLNWFEELERLMAPWNQR